MDAIRLVAIAEPAGASVTTGMAGPMSDGRRVLDRVIASRLDGGVAVVRWGVGSGRDDASATTHAAAALQVGREHGADLGFVTGDPWRDGLLADLALVLTALLDDLTPRQAEIAGMVLVERARQAAVATALGVSRATVSVAVARGRLPAIAGARRAIEALLAGPPHPGRPASGGGPPASPLHVGRAAGAAGPAGRRSR